MYDLDDAPAEVIERMRQWEARDGGWRGLEAEKPASDPVPAPLKESDKVVLFPPEAATHDLVSQGDGTFKMVPKEKPEWQDRLELLELLEEHGGPDQWNNLAWALAEAGWTSDRAMELFHQLEELKEALEFSATALNCWEDKEEDNE